MISLTQYLTNKVNLFNIVNNNGRCKVTNPMNTTPTTDEGISDKIDKAVGKTLQNRKHEILEVHQETGYTLSKIIELALKNGLEYTAKSVNSGRRHKILHENEVAE